MDYQDIIYTKEDGIARITMNRPDRMNALIPGITKGIHRAVKDAANDDKVRVLVITGSGRAFCSGGDVSAMVEKSSQPSEEPEEEKWTASNGSLYVLVHRFEKPLIAAINGVAAGGGLDLALACDIRIASDKARFSEIYVRRGMVPVGGGTYFLPRLVGIDRACQLILTGDMIDAKEAERIGLVTMVVPHEELESATREMAEKLAKGAPLAIKAAKRAIYEGVSWDLEKTLEYTNLINLELRGTEDHKEGARAFVEKREPFFKGR